MEAKGNNADRLGSLIKSDKAAFFDSERKAGQTNISDDIRKEFVR